MSINAWMDKENVAFIHIGDYSFVKDNKIISSQKMGRTGNHPVK